LENFEFAAFYQKILKLYEEVVCDGCLLK
jgi:hypothetical protein